MPRGARPAGVKGARLCAALVAVRWAIPSRCRPGPDDAIHFHTPWCTPCLAGPRLWSGQPASGSARAVPCRAPAWPTFARLARLFIIFLHGRRSSLPEGRAKPRGPRSLRARGPLEAPPRPAPPRKYALALLLLSSSLVGGGWHLGALAGRPGVLRFPPRTRHQGTLGPCCDFRRPPRPPRRIRRA